VGENLTRLTQRLRGCGHSNKAVLKQRFNEDDQHGTTDNSVIWMIKEKTDKESSDEGAMCDVHEGSVLHADRSATLHTAVKWQGRLLIGC
jgi:hypothetical protein